MLDSRLRSRVTPSDPTSRVLRDALDTLAAYRTWLEDDSATFGRAWFTTSSEQGGGLRSDFRRAIEAIVAGKRQEAEEKRSCATAAEAAVRIAGSNRLGPRKRLGLLLFLEGVPVRQCAKLVGLADHAALFRVADRYGLREIHRRRRSPIR